MNKYSQKLKEERKIRGFSQDELAKAIGISQASISYYENGVNEPSIGICEKIADFYEITIDELIGRTEKKYSNITYNNSTHNGNNNL